jgi:hypothetical protein
MVGWLGGGVYKNKVGKMMVKMDVRKNPKFL